MSNFDTISAITDNIETVLKNLGINFTREVYDNVDSVPASILPHGRIFYVSESFEYPYGQKPAYADAVFRATIILMNRDALGMIRDQQKWAHNIREAITVNALNVGSLSTTKYVSLASITSIDIDNTADKSALDITIQIRYREV